MKNEDVRVGMKVVPHQKTVAGYGFLNESRMWRGSKDLGYLYVQEWIDDYECWALGPSSDAGTPGDFFNAEDFELYDNSWLDEKIVQLQSELKFLRQLKRKNEKTRSS